jgi:hypothetical protein
LYSIIFTCELNSPEAKYKASTSREKIHKQKKKQENFNNNNKNHNTKPISFRECERPETVRLLNAYKGDLSVIRRENL